MTSLTQTPELSPSSSAEATASPRRGRLLPIGFGSLALLAALSLIGSAIAGTYGLGTYQDSTGYLATQTHHYQTSAYAFSTESLNVGGGVGDLEAGLVRIRISATSANAAKPLFIGIAPTQDVTRYLAGVRHDELRDIKFAPFSVAYRPIGHGAPKALPASQTFWRTRVSGTGTQTITWPVHTGQWSAVVMNADGSRGVSVDATLGARIAGAWWFVIAGYVLGALALVTGIALVRLGVRRRTLETSSDTEEV